ncbi:sigma B [Avian orthoreovirus]|uniref:Sigma B n=1 Tax=Avian orthoreovirus TaxID=38170 RepID=A0A0N9HCH0_9REOV|nr:sigma B [Avian orthoreovirus]
MEVRVPNFHSFVEGITSSYIRTPACWNAKTTWDVETFHLPDVIKVGNAYCCSQCCGVLYYGVPPPDGNCFPHHKCHQQQYRNDTPLLRYVRIGRTTEHLLDQYAVALQTIADYYEEASLRVANELEENAIAALDIVTRTESIRSDRAVDADFWMYPLERRSDDSRREIAASIWKMIDASARSFTLPDCLVSPSLHSRQVFDQMLTTTSIYDVAASGRTARFSPMVAALPQRTAGPVTLADADPLDGVATFWSPQFALSPMIGGVGITGQYARESYHHVGHPVVGSGKKVSHYRNLFMEAWRGWSKSSFTCAAGLEPAECESRLRGHARTMLGRSLPEVCDCGLEAQSRAAMSSLQKATKLTFMECGW